MPMNYIGLEWEAIHDTPENASVWTAKIVHPTVAKVWDSPDTYLFIRLHRRGAHMPRISLK